MFVMMTLINNVIAKKKTMADKIVAYMPSCLVKLITNAISESKMNIEIKILGPATDLLFPTFTNVSILMMDLIGMSPESVTIALEVTTRSSCSKSVFVFARFLLDSIRIDYTNVILLAMVS